MNKPIFKWAGGKTRILPQLESVIPKGKRLIEPFAGGSVVSLNFDFESYLINDINSDLINFYSELKCKGKTFIDICSNYFNISNNNPEAFYELRKRFNESREPYLFLYLNRHCFNGLTRYNKDGDFNAPFGKYDSPYFPEEEMWFFIGHLKKITLKCQDFRKIFSRLHKGDVVYCDPPYIPRSKTSSFTAFTGGGFDLKDQEDLAKCAERSRDKGISVIISNSDTEESRDIFDTADTTHTITARRSIAASGDARGSVSEIIAIYDRGK